MRSENREPNAHNVAQTSYPLALTKAAQLLAAGFERADKERGLSQREIARQLGYKQSVVLSHMALGRAPVPIDRALDLARSLDLDESEFLLAVLEQRHPGIDFQTLICPERSRNPVHNRTSARDQQILEDLRALAGCSLSELPRDQLAVMREAAIDLGAARRWISIFEIPIVELIRKLRPDVARRGLSAEDADKIAQTLGGRR